jgi:hypothetical protein
MFLIMKYYDWFYPPAAGYEPSNLGLWVDYSTIVLRRHDTQHNNTYLNDTQKNAIQYEETKHNDIQHIFIIKNLTLSITALSTMAVLLP